MKKAISIFCSGFLLASTMISALSATKIHHPDLDGVAAATATPPHLKYYGGVVISSIKLHSVLWGPYVNQEVAKNMLSYLPALAGFEWIKGLAEYNTVGLSGSKNQTIGVGSFTGQTQINPINQKTYITDAEVSAELTAQIAAGRLPAPTLDANGLVQTMYVVEFPPGMTIAMDAEHASCSYFCAYHGSAVAKNGVTYTYSVQPDFTDSGCANGCGMGTMLENQQAVHCHEVAEAITDPLIGKINGLTWYDEANGEIADICVAQQQHVTLNGKDYVVQKLWCNKSQQCLAILPGADGTTIPTPPPVIPTPPPTTPSDVSPTASTIVASTPISATSGILATTITVTLKTSKGAPVAGKSVTLSASSTWAVITPGPVVTNTAGVAQFTVFEGNTETVTFTATDTTDNIVLLQKATVAFNTNVDPIVTSPVVAAPASLLANGVDSSIITVTLKDGSGKAVAGKKIAITQDGHSWIRTLSSVTNASGEATFSIVNKTVENVTYTVKNTTDGTKVGTVSVNFQPNGRSPFGGSFSEEELNRVVSADASTVVAASSVIGLENKVIIVVTLNTAEGLPVSGREVALASSSPDHADFFPVSGTTDVAGMVTFVVTGNWKPETVFFSAYDVTDGVSITQVAKVVFQGHIMLD